MLLPRIIFGSAYADMRLVPFMLAIFMLAIRFKAETVYPLAPALALAAVGFLLVAHCRDDRQHGHRRQPPGAAARGARRMCRWARAW